MSFGGGDESVRAARVEEGGRAVVRVARVLLVLALVGGGWLTYRRLPPDAPRPGVPRVRPTERTNLRVVLYTPEARASAGEAVELYSIDAVAAEREYRSERRAGVRFEQFLRERMRTRPKVSGRFDERGEAMLAAAPGRWWVHAHTAAGDTEWTWRLPVNLAGREQRLELTPENAYTRTQSY